MKDEDRLRRTREYWDSEAATFDDEADHGLRDLGVHRAWADALTGWLPAPPASVMDVGCGTGSLSILLSGLGHEVTAIDLSPAMIAQAREKAKTAASPIDLHVMDASRPRFAPHRFDVIVCRHLLWALPEPAQVVGRWVELLAQGGRLVLVEGCWATGVGLHSAEVIAALPSSLTSVSVQRLSHRTELWGGTISDERYVVVARS